MNFNEKQRTAIFFFLRMIAIADGKVDPNETALIIIAMHEIGVIDANKIINDADNMNSAEACALILSLSESQKKYVCALYGSLIMADGDADEKELAIWSLVSSICNFPSMTIAEAISLWKSTKK